MKLVAFETVAKALDAAQVRYLVAGGLAVNAHALSKRCRRSATRLRSRSPPICLPSLNNSGSGWKKKACRC